MKVNKNWFLLLWFYMPLLGAAPLDGLLSLGDEAPWRGEIVASMNKVNEQLDVLGIRNQDTEFAGTSVGDYEGYYVRLGYQVGQSLGLMGGYWQRRFDVGNDEIKLKTYQLAGTWTIAKQQQIVPSLSLRLSWWSNKSDNLQSASVNGFDGLPIDQVRITDVQDQQRQLDMILAWQLTPTVALSVFTGAGKSQVKFDNFNVRMQGCDYQIKSPSKNEISVILDQEDTTGCTLLGFYQKKKTESYPGVGMGVGYQSTYFQLGSLLRWRIHSWQLRGGLRYLQLKRGIDSAVRDKGNTVYETNMIVVGEIAKQLTRRSALFLQAQYMQHLWVGEIPLVYNVYTAHRVDKKYGFLSAGVVYQF